MFTTRKIESSVRDSAFKEHCRSLDNAHLIPQETSLLFIFKTEKSRAIFIHYFDGRDSDITALIFAASGRIGKQTGLFSSLADDRASRWQRFGFNSVPLAKTLFDSIVTKATASHIEPCDSSDLVHAFIAKLNDWELLSDIDNVISNEYHRAFGHELVFNELRSASNNRCVIL